MFLPSKSMYDILVPRHQLTVGRLRSALANAESKCCPLRRLVKKKKKEVEEEEEEEKNRRRKEKGEEEEVRTKKEQAGKE